MIRAKLTATALAAAGLVALVGPASAAPVLSNTAALKQSVASDVEQVRWRGNTAAAAGLGFLGGAIVGSAIANSNRGYYYGEPYGYGGAYAYDPGYYAAPAPRYYNRGYYGGGVNSYCGRVDSSGVTRFDNCY
jgi:hypothetical protein